MTNQIDQEALARAIEIVRKNRVEGKLINERLAKGGDWFDVASGAAYSCQMIALGLKPWMRPPCHAHITEPRRDEQGIALLHRLLAAGLSRYEPDPLQAIEQTQRRAST